MAWWIRSVALAGFSLLACWCAGAADLLSHAPPAAPELRPTLAPGDNWSGPHVGVYGGGSFASANGVLAAPVIPPDLTQAISSQVNASGTGPIHASSALVGVQAGWDLRLYDNYVVGVEADVSYIGLRGSRTEHDTIPSYDAPYTLTQQLSSDWQATLRARAGYLVNPSLLLFVEAGPAFGSFKYSSNYADWVPIAGYYKEYENASANAFKIGLTLGGGVEYMLGPNLSLRGEYLYTRFPSLNMSGVTNDLLPDTLYATVGHRSGALSQNMFKIGVNYWIR